MRSHGWISGQGDKNFLRDWKGRTILLMFEDVTFKSGEKWQKCNICQCGSNLDSCISRVEVLENSDALVLTHRYTVIHMGDSAVGGCQTNPVKSVCQSR